MNSDERYYYDDISEETIYEESNQESLNEASDSRPPKPCRKGAEKKVTAKTKREKKPKRKATENAGTKFDRKDYSFMKMSFQYLF